MRWVPPSPLNEEPECPRKKPQPASRSTSCSKRPAGASSRRAASPPTSGSSRASRSRPADLDALGDDFEKTGKGFIDFLLLDAKGFPLIVLEAKAEDKNPLVGKEQARKYATLAELPLRHPLQRQPALLLGPGARQPVRHHRRSRRPTRSIGYQKVTPEPAAPGRRSRSATTTSSSPSARPTQSEAGWKNEAERPAYIQANKLRFLRPYQLKAIHALQAAVREGKDRFLFEMATGTGKTLTAAAVIKLFLRTGNARRVLFLVDRLELEDQAKKAFAALLSADFQTVIYKENRDDWRRAEIVVTTVQSLLFNNKYQRLFSPTDFDLVISDEAHRSIGGNARAVFDYFIGYKLGLTATPRDYLQALRQRRARRPATRARPSAACCSTPTAPSAARTASRPSATPCSTA